MEHFKTLTSVRWPHRYWTFRGLLSRPPNVHIYEIAERSVSFDEMKFTVSATLTLEELLILAEVFRFPEPPAPMPPKNGPPTVPPGNPTRRRSTRRRKPNRCPYCLWSAHAAPNKTALLRANHIFRKEAIRLKTNADLVCWPCVKVVNTPSHPI